MPNYKPQLAKDSINIAGFVHQLADDDILVQLDYPDGAEATTHSLVSTLDNANYKVPTGRKLRIFLFQTGRALDAGCHLITSTAEDGNTAEIVIMSRYFINFSSDDTIVFIDVPAGRYINFEDTGANFHQITLLCIEVKA